MMDIETRYGLLQVLGAERDLIERFLRRYGEWARYEVLFIAAALPAAPVRVLDIGAYLGTFGIGLSAERSVSSLVFVEANSKIASALRENARRNARAPAEVVEAVVAPREMALSGHMDPDNFGSLSFAPWAAAEGRVAVEEPARRVSLSELRGEFGEFDLIKMDVEGLEGAVLADDAEVLGAGGPALWLECNDTVESLDLADLLLKAGQSVYYFGFPAYSPDNYRGDREPLFPNAYEAGLWASRGTAPKLTRVLKKVGCILRKISSREDLRLALWQTPRWGPRHWQGASLETVVAEGARALCEEHFDEFLVPNCAKSLTREQLRAELEQCNSQCYQSLSDMERCQSQLHQSVADLERCQSLLHQSRVELKSAYTVLDDERARVTSLQNQSLNQQALIATHRAAETWVTQKLGETEQKLGKTEQKLSETEQTLSGTEQKLSETEQKLRGTEQRLSEIEQSTGWRALKRIRAILRLRVGRTSPTAPRAA